MCHKIKNSMLRSQNGNMQAYKTIQQERASGRVPIDHPTWDPRDGITLKVAISIKSCARKMVRRTGWDRDSTQLDQKS